MRKHGGTRHEAHEAAVWDGAGRQNQCEDKAQLLVIEWPEAFQTSHAMKQTHARVEQQHCRYEHSEDRHWHVEAYEQVLIKNCVIEKTNRADDDDAGDADDECS